MQYAIFVAYIHFPSLYIAIWDKEFLPEIKNDNWDLLYHSKVLAWFYLLSFLNQHCMVRVHNTVGWQILTGYENKQINSVFLVSKRQINFYGNYYKQQI